MVRNTRGWTARALSVAALCALAGSVAIGQRPEPGTGEPMVTNTGAFTPFVENMDRSLAFYHDVFDMEIPPMPASGSRPYNNRNDRLFRFFDIMGAKERHQSARVKGIRTGVEAMEIQQVGAKKINLRVQDPGNATLVLLVRDVDATLARVKQANYPVVTPAGKPVEMADGSRAVLIRDVDDRFLQIRQPLSIPADAPQHNIVGIRAEISVVDLDKTNQVYKDIFKFTVENVTPFSADKGQRALTGLSKAEVRRSSARARDSQLWFDFIEYKGVDRTPLKMRIQDHGATRIQLNTQNIDAMTAKAKAAGLHIVTIDGGPQPIPPNMKGTLISDPNNLFVSLFEACNGCAPREVPPGTAGAAAPAAQGAPAAAAAPPAVMPPSLYREEWKEVPVPGGGQRTDENQRVSPVVVGNPNLELKVYGPDAKVVRVARHEGRVDIWTGMSTSPVAVMIRDKRNFVDLTGLARMRWVLRTNAIHPLHPIVKLPDGTLLTGDRTLDTHGEFLLTEIPFVGMRWYKVEPTRIAVMEEVVNPNLGRIDEVGVATFAPGGGHGIAGSANLSHVELFAKGIPR